MLVVGGRGASFLHFFRLSRLYLSSLASTSFSTPFSPFLKEMTQIDPQVLSCSPQHSRHNSKVTTIKFAFEGSIGFFPALEYSRFQLSVLFVYGANTIGRS